MKPEAILSSCERAGVSIRMVDGKLKASGDKKAVAEILPMLQAHREAIRAYLVSAPSKIDADRWRYQYHEREGIISEDKNLAPYASRLAYLETQAEYVSNYAPTIAEQFKRIIFHPTTH